MQYPNKAYNQPVVNATGITFEPESEQASLDLRVAYGSIQHCRFIEFGHHGLRVARDSNAFVNNCFFRGLPSSATPEGKHSFGLKLETGATVFGSYLDFSSHPGNGIKVDAQSHLRLESTVFRENHPQYSVAVVGGSTAWFRGIDFQGGDLWIYTNGLVVFEDCRIGGRLRVKQYSNYEIINPRNKYEIDIVD